MSLLAAPTEMMADSLREWALDAYGSGARVDDVRDLGGHSGETYGFSLHHTGLREDLVARLAPAALGKEAGDALIRQASLLDRLHASGVKVPAVRDLCVEQPWFGSTCMIVELLAGAPLIMGPEGLPSWLTADQRRDAYRCATVELSKLHSREVADGLAEWDATRTPADEIRLWTRAIERAAEPGWARAGLALGQALLASIPERWTVGACHGDYQTNNVLFVLASGQVGVSGVVDWELAHIGAVELDFGWFLMMNDSRAWDPVELRGDVDRGRLLSWYHDMSGFELESLRWFQALACYRMAAIAGYQIRLHRTGRKIDPAWERASSSMPRFIARAYALLEEV